MRLDYLLKARLAHSVREPVFLVFIVLSIAISVSAALIAAEKQQAGFDVAVVSEDSGDLGDKLLSYIFDIKDFSAQEMPRQSALRLLQNDRLDALIVIRDNFSESLLSGEFQNTLELFTSPSSQAPATISEPVINGAMMLWLEEFSAIRTREYLMEKGKEYSLLDEEGQREEMRRLWESGAMIRVETVELDSRAASSHTALPLHTCTKWYCAFSLFYFLHAASWVLAIHQRGLAERLRQTNIPTWSMILSHSLPSLLVGLLGYLIAGVLGSALTGGGFSPLIPTLIPVVLYLATLVGMTLFVVSIFQSTISLMFLAPVLTFLSAVMSGLLIELPKWAYALIWLSHGLPGKWLARSLEDPLQSLPGAFLCCVLWVSAGMALSIHTHRTSGRRRHGRLGKAKRESPC